MVPQQRKRRCPTWEHCSGGHLTAGDDEPHDSDAPEIAQTAIWVRRYPDGSQVTVLNGPQHQPLSAEETRALARESVRMLVLHGASQAQVDAAAAAIDSIRLAS